MWEGVSDTNFLSPRKGDSDLNKIACLVLARPCSLRDIPVHLQQCSSKSSKISACVFVLGVT